MSTPDASVDATPDRMLDATPPDVTPPEVVMTAPPDGEEVEPNVSLVIDFSEPLRQDQGTVTVGDLTFNAEAGLFSTPSQVFIQPAEPFDAGIDLLVTIDGFADLAGNPMADPFEFTLRIVDRVAPTVTASTPAEGAMDVTALTDELVITFSEPMDQGAGEIIVSGGAGGLGDPVWNAESNIVTYPITGLEYEQRYSLSLENFVDPSGNDLEIIPYLDDGAIDFTTGVDNDPPVVTASNPTEGQMGVDANLPAVTITFNERMDTSIRGATITDGTNTQDLTGTWNSTRDRIDFELNGFLEFPGTYSLSLTGQGYVDRRGNALDETTYLMDGALDFMTGMDTFGPVAIDSDPAERDSMVDPSIATVQVSFNEAMDPAITTVPLFDGTNTVNVDVSYTMLDTVAQIDVDGALVAGTTYTLDLTALADPSGNVLDATGPYLGDGILEFTTRPPSGANCSEPLTMADSMMVMGARQWVFPLATRNDDDGGTDSCDLDSNGARGDAVIEYVKTSADLAGGGNLLKINTQSANFNDVNIEVRQNTCEPGADADQLACVHSIEDLRDTYLDVGPGTYYIWVAADTTSSSWGATISVEEVAAWPEGESCADPLDVMSPSHTLAGDTHTWVIPAMDISAWDRAPSTSDALVSCDTSPTTPPGSDMVIEFNKASATSVVTVTLSPTSTSESDLNLEITSACDPAGADVYGCSFNLSTGTVTQTFAGPAGPFYVWVVNDDSFQLFPGATVTITETPVGVGEACSNARPIAGPGAATIMRDSTRRFNPGSCFDTVTNVTWYEYTPTNDVVVGTGNAGGGVMILDPTNGSELSCSTDSSTRPIGRLVEAGESVCIGFANSGTVTSMTFAESAYTGVGNTVTDLNVSRGFTSSGSEASWSGHTWMGLTPTTIYLGSTSSIFQFPRTGNVRSVYLTTAQGVSSSLVGYNGWGVGETLFTLDNTSSSSTNRLFRAYDGVSFPWSATAWDGSASYASQDMHGLVSDGTNFYYATHSTTNVQIYSVPVASPGSATEIGSNDVVEDVNDIEIDTNFIYFSGQADLPGESDVQGVFRIRRSDLGTASTQPDVITRIQIGSSSSSSFGGGKMFLDRRVNPRYLYVRSQGLFDDDFNRIHVIADPGGAAVDLGPLVEVGRYLDEAMTFDPATNTIYLLETRSDSLGRVVRVD